jgi:glyoxylase-like metal-dependent hydrolase (beta-lactamase superfamily II)
VAIRTVVTGSFQENCYLVWDAAGPNAVIIDPGDDSDAIQATIAEEGLHPVAILLTHAHLDHVGAVDDLREQYGLPVFAAEGERDLLAWVPESYRFFGLPERPAPKVDHWLALACTNLLEADPKLILGALEVEIIPTPGHTPGGTSYRIGADLFPGDTLFKDSIGRTDLPGGNLDILAESLGRLMALPGDLNVYPGHGPATTIARERADNPYIQELVPGETLRG